MSIIPTPNTRYEALMSQITFDREPVLTSSVRDLDFQLVFKTIQQGLNLRRFTIDDVPGLTPEALRVGDEEAALRYLERFGGVVWVGETPENRRHALTVAGVLAFTLTPDVWVESSGVDLAIYRTDPRRLARGLQAVPPPTHANVYPVRGPIFSIIDRTVEILRNECATSSLEGARIVTRLDTPLNVLRELTANGVVHRDLTFLGELVRIQVFPSAIEWISPGRLPPEKFPDDVPLTLELLLRAQYARNPRLAMFLFHAGYIEKFGFGLDDVVATLEAEGRDPPGFHNDTHSFRVRVVRNRTPEPGTIIRDTPESRVQRILALFAETPTWAPQALEARLGIPRTTLFIDLRRLTKEGRIRVSGATRNRVYTRTDEGTS
jgi:predicted HTH transcriptional regulator